MLRAGHGGLGRLSPPQAATFESARPAMTIFLDKETWGRLASFQNVNKVFAHRLLRHQLVAGLFGKGREVAQ